MTTPSTKHFHMNDEYEMVVVSKEQFENPDPSWPNNKMIVEKTSDGLVSVKIDMSNIGPRDLVSAVYRGLLS